jgi:hypothetical protein
MMYSVTPAASTDVPRAASSRSARLDPLCAAAVELAAAVARDVLGPDQVGDHLSVQPDEDRVVTHLFEALQPGYRGWRWAVTVARASRSKLVTVDEICLLPGPDALLAPEWLPWSERLRPGDLGVGDLLPTAPDDDRLAPAYLLSDDPAVEEVAFELGLGRRRVMSRTGRLEGAERWYDGEGGPAAAMARHAPARCGTCGFWLSLAGTLSAAFGVCGNEFAPRDGMVVSVDHGCGAHSEALVEDVPAPLPPVVFDDSRFDIEQAMADADDVEADLAGTVVVDAEAFDPESLDVEVFDLEALDSEAFDAEVLDAEALDAGALDAEALDAGALDAEPEAAATEGRVAELGMAGTNADVDADEPSSGG